MINGEGGWGLGTGKDESHSEVCCQTGNYREHLNLNLLELPEGRGAGIVIKHPSSRQFWEVLVSCLRLYSARLHWPEALRWDHRRVNVCEGRCHVKGWGTSCVCSLDPVPRVKDHHLFELSRL